MSKHVSFQEMNIQVSLTDETIIPCSSAHMVTLCLALEELPEILTWLHCLHPIHNVWVLIFVYGLNYLCLLLSIFFIRHPGKYKVVSKYAFVLC